MRLRSTDHFSDKEKNASLRPGFFCLVVFFSLLLSAMILYWQTYSSLKQNAENRLLQAVERINQTIGFAEHAVMQSDVFLGMPCRDDTFTSLRMLAASTPDIRSINMTRNGYIYCSSVYGRELSIHEKYPDSRILLREGQLLLPGIPVMTLQSFSDDGHTGILANIDGYYLRNILSLSSDYTPVYLQVGNTIMTDDGKLLEATFPEPLNIKRVWQKTSTRENFRVFTRVTSAALWHFYTENHLGSTLLLALFSVGLGGCGYYLAGVRDSSVRRLRKAIQKGEIQPWIQPVYSASRELTGGEILARWVCQDGEVIPPEHFISLAENNHLIIPLTCSLFHQVQAHFTSEQVVLPDGFHFAFNISPAHFETMTLILECSDFLLSFGARNINLVLEVTERQSIQPGTSQNILRQLREKGILLALDDFGTGHSGLDYLREYRFDFLKIDRSFTRDVISKTHVGNIVENIAMLAERLNMLTVAEGVETQAQLEELKKYGVAYFQGYYLSRPVTLVDFTTHLRQQNRQPDVPD